MPRPVSPTRSTHRRLILAGLAASLVAVALAAPIAAAAGAAGVVPTDDATPARHGAAERLALRLLNCTRTGGKVRADGTCKGYGSGRYSARVPALRLRDGISDRVAYPWSAAMVSVRECAHNIDGLPDVGRRFAQAGFGYQFYGENIGCAWGGTSARAMVIRSHLAMQAEQRDGGGHWRNIKNRGYRSVGIGVASLDGWTTVVFDFYGR